MSARTVRLIGGPKDGEWLTVLYGDSIIVYEPAIVGEHQMLMADPVITTVRRGEYDISDDQTIATWRGQ